MNITQWSEFCRKNEFNQLEVEHLEGKQLYVAEKLKEPDKDLSVTYYDMRWGLALGEKMDLVRNINIPAYRPDGVLVMEFNRVRIVMDDVKKHVDQMKRVGRWR